MSEAASAAAARGTGVHGDATPNEAIAGMAREIQGRLASFKSALGNLQGPVTAANLQALAGQQNYREVGNGFVATDHATAFLRLVGHQTTEVRVAQEGLLRAQLSASEAAAAMVNHSLSAEGGAHPMFGNLLTALLALAGTLTSSLGRINDDRWRQLAGNLTPHVIADYGTPADAVKAAIVLMSCQFQVQARLVPFNFSGAPIDARFKGVDEAVRAACAADGRCLSEADVSAFARHALGVSRFRRYPTDDCPTNVLLLRIWAAASLDEVFEASATVPAAVERDPVYRGMRYGDRAGMIASPTARAMQLGGFSEEAPAFRSGATDPMMRPPTLQQAQQWRAAAAAPAIDPAETSDDDDNEPSGYAQQQAQMQQATAVLAANKPSDDDDDDQGGYAVPAGLKAPSIGNWADDRSNATSTAPSTAAMSASAGTPQSGRHMLTSRASDRAAAQMQPAPSTGTAVQRNKPAGSGTDGSTSAATTTSAGAAAATSSTPSWAAATAQRKKSSLAAAFS